MPVSHPFTSLMHSGFLGSGISSRVFAICNQDNHTLKVMTDEEDSEHESAMLRIIEKEKIPHVPRLIEAGQGALVLSPRATPIVVGQLHCRHALQILDTSALEAIHKISLYHRDIHPANLILVGHDISSKTGLRWARRRRCRVRWDLPPCQRSSARGTRFWQLCLSSNSGRRFGIAGAHNVRAQLQGATSDA